jgi:hypothetical protein
VVQKLQFAKQPLCIGVSLAHGIILQEFGGNVNLKNKER